MARAFHFIVSLIRRSARPPFRPLIKQQRHAFSRPIGSVVAVAGTPVALSAFAFFSSSSTPVRKTPPKEMAEFVGKYKLVSSENFDEYMKALGVGMMTRKMANAATPVTDIVFENGEFYIKTSTTFKTTELKFKLDEEFEETTGDGRVCKTTVTRDGNKLIQEQRGEKPSTITREFNGDTMKMVLVVGDITCTRIYKKE